MNPVTDPFGNGGYALFWGMLVIALVLFGRRARDLYRFLKLGASEERFDRKGQRFVKMASTVVLQVCSLKNVSKEDRAGIGHALIFWGFIAFAVSTLDLIWRLIVGRQGFLDGALAFWPPVVDGFAWLTGQEAGVIRAGGPVPHQVVVDEVDVADAVAPGQHLDFVDHR